jgi:hypothetical protein
MAHDSQRAATESPGVWQLDRSVGGLRVWMSFSDAVTLGTVVLYRWSKRSLRAVRCGAANISVSPSQQRCDRAVLAQRRDLVMQDDDVDGLTRNDLDRVLDGIDGGECSNGWRRCARPG